MIYVECTGECKFLINKYLQELANGNIVIYHNEMKMCEIISLENWHFIQNIICIVTAIR